MSMLAVRKTRLRFNRRLREKGVPAQACGSCFAARGLGAFHRKGDGHRSVCKACRGEHHAENREAIRTKRAEYYAENAEIERERTRRYQRTPAGRAMKRATNTKRRALTGHLIWPAERLITAPRREPEL
jgi:hypothetical protein